MVSFLIPINLYLPYSAAAASISVEPGIAEAEAEPGRHHGRENEEVDGTPYC